MDSAMTSAFAIGRPTDHASATAVLGTGSGYVRGAASTVAKMDEGITRREEALAKLDPNDPTASKEREQLDLLHRLRDRINLSMERVSDILAGKDRDDIDGVEETGGAGDGSSTSTTKRRRLDDVRAAEARELRERDELDLLERRRALLASSIVPTTTDATRVAGVYASASVTNPR